MAKRRRSRIAPDPLWYEDAVIYQLHVKSFFDSNNDGVGDFRGLMAKLDYLAEMGITAIWLLPFYPSPRRDDGYDISDYRGVHPEYGTLSDFKLFIDEAHARGIRVITELVLNHTSDQHPWFQRARHAKPGTAARNFYVWSEDDKAYAGTRIIFLDTEKSNWTWDDTAQAYYWHRFYSHQPDLNFDNPLVLRAMLNVMRFWLDLGVDGLRLDAVPYLVEREGTNNENLPETHAILKRIRAEIEARYPDRMLLAEANQWPEDAQQYFGQGDESHMVFHFPLMPRMYMAIAQEDRFPVTDILRQTPDIPPNCQWAIFLRNHDELTLEMVTDRERDYLWNFYAADRKARLNLGIRRRLAPLLERDRRRIELMNSLLLTMPGTPIIYYGDEIGMGDNLHLGDRDGVRTPMQWSPDRNGGFSRADPAALVLPPIMDPLYGYEAVNVEAQLRDTHSLLNWTRRMLIVRGRYKAFGRGRIRFLRPANRKALAYLREYEDETILCVANVSRAAQAVELDLNEFAGRTPVELLGGTAFPAIGRLNYLFTLPPYGHYWFLLSSSANPPSWSTAAMGLPPEHHTFVLRRDLREIVEEPSRRILEEDILPAYVMQRRWFQHKGERIGAVRIAAVAPTPGDTDFLFGDVNVAVGSDTVRYSFPMAIAWEDATPAPFEGTLAFARVRLGRRVGVLTDGFMSAKFVRAILGGLAREDRLAFDGGTLVFRPAPGVDFAHMLDADILWLSAEQSNSSLIVGREAVVKLYRRAVAGVHPESEMIRALTERGFTGIAAFMGEVVRRSDDGAETAMAIVQCFVANQGDGFSWTVDWLKRLAEEHPAPVTGEAEGFESYESYSLRLGRRLGEMHAVLAKPSENPDFAPERAGKDATHTWANQAKAQIASAASALAAAAGDLNESGDFQVLLGTRRDELFEAVEQICAASEGVILTRIHGDLHLGQILVAGNDVVIIDFEGEPLKPLSERRGKTSPLRDVAGILRSFDYAAGAAARDIGEAQGGHAEARVSALLDEFRHAAKQAFLAGYAEGLGRPLDEKEFRLLEVLCLERAAYEVVYEYMNRPSWLDLPLGGLLESAKRILEVASS